MNGVVRKIVERKGYGFVDAGPKQSYFLHKMDFDGDWERLEEDVNAGKSVTVEFEGERTKKGLRATSARIVNSDSGGKW